MLIIKFKELLAAKERKLGRRISLEEICKETSISRVTLSRIAGPAYYNMTMDSLDCLCQYFDCKTVGDLVEYIPDEKAVTRTITLNNVKKWQHIINNQLIERVIERLSDLGLPAKQYEIEREKRISQRPNGPRIDLVLSLGNTELIFIEVRNKLHYGLDRLLIERLLSYNPSKLIILTMDYLIPKDLHKIIREFNIGVFQIELTLDESAQNLQEVKFCPMDLS